VSGVAIAPEKEGFCLGADRAGCVLGTDFEEGSRKKRKGAKEEMRDFEPDRNAVSTTAAGRVLQVL